jgi:hypothetical protein
VIHVATVHHKSAQWIDVQLAYLRRHLHEPYRVVANLESVEPGHDSKFDRVVPAVGRHAGKLNYLAAEIVAEAAPDDLLMFLDGDAFPIADPMPTVHAALDETVLVAVRRAENGEDQQPHPSFCVIRVRDWDRLRGDWSMGHCWETEWGQMVSDSGGNLLAALQRNEEKWTPLLRTNRVNLHPLWFGIYGDVVYHHGAGFRIAVARSISAEAPPRRWRRGEQHSLIGASIKKIDSIRIARWESRQMGVARKLGATIFEELRVDPDFYRQFL